MSTVSEVKKGLVDVSTIIVNVRSVLTRAKIAMSSSVSELNSIPTTFSSIIAEINSYTPTGAFETLAKDELSKLTAEFIALRNAAQDAVTALSSITEF